MKLQFVVQFRQLLSDGAASLHVCVHSHQLCIRAAAVRGNPVVLAAPDGAFSPAPPAGPLWSLPPTDAPSVTSCANTATNRFAFILVLEFHKL